MLNSEKCHFMVRVIEKLGHHFMVKESVLLGHHFSNKWLKVDQVKVGVIEKLSLPTNVKCVKSFLDHTQNYRKFIKDVWKITKSICQLLFHDVTFHFTEECLNTFETLKKFNFNL